jgi:hypothetical protein
MSRREDSLVRELAEKLAPKFKKIFTNRKPSASSRLRKRIEARLGYVPLLQPEIDICFLDRKGLFNAAEVKVFTGSEFSFKTPFYEGIGQALALHRYGFDASALWFLFPGRRPPARINEYGPEAWAFVQNDLRLHLDFSYFFVEETNSGHVFHVMQYNGRQNGYALLPIDDTRFPIEWRHPNPIRCLPVQKALRETLEWYLGISDEAKS